ncbi:RNA-binding protein 25-like isoform X1 [Ischnura elegans]|uniref:RNA-binding protein 25-like isoform X1 n=2 Tax=Ischnura elegans TaxID=197161 RepID=UPI001ED88527|nr:RNA-binding protein 25-like isoform X1 [Ischnura elegans]
MSRIPSEFLNASSSLNETNNLQYISTPGGSSVDLLVMSFPGRPPMVPGIPVPPMTMPYMGLGAPPPLVPTVGIPMPHMIAPPPLPPMPAPAIRPYRAAPHHNHHSAPVPPTPAPATSIPPLIPPTSNMRSNSFSKRVQQGDNAGPPVTVFVGNITERAPDAMIRHILSACGHVVSWKRVQGASAFGFCEYSGPDAGLRAVRLLHDLEIGGKKLVVKVDAKTKLVLDNYKVEQRKKLQEGGTPPLPDSDPPRDDSKSKDEEGVEDTDYMDDGMRHSDDLALERIQQVVADYEMDMKNYTPPASKSEKNERKMSKTQEKLMKLSQGSDMLSGDSTPIFDDVEMEEGKRDLITREIGKFREIMKKQEEEKEAERRRREMKERERKERDGVPISTPSTPPDDAMTVASMGSVSSLRPSESSSRARQISPVRSLSRSRSRERLPSQPPRSPSPPDRHGTPSSTAPSSTSSRLRSKARERDRGRRSHSRSRDRDDGPAKKSEKDLMREREEEEELKEKKKMDRRAREKEAAYQERLRNWEGRERRKAKEQEKERERERLRQEEQSREAKRLKEFLEDYDDERDDPKFYKGRELQRRLAEREKESEQDSRDRQREREELEELKARIFAEGHSDPGAEFERLRRRREEQYRPTILVRVDPPGRPQQPPPLPPTHRSSRPQPPPPRPEPPSINIQPRPPQTPPEVMEREQPPEPEEEEPEDEVCEEEQDVDDNDDDGVDNEPMHMEDDGDGEDEDMVDRGQLEMERRREPRMDEDESQMSRVSMVSSVEQSPASAIPASNTALEPTGALQWGNSPSPNAGLLMNNAAATQPRKKKLDVKEVFNMDDDDDSNLGTAKKRKLVPLDYGDDKKKKEEKKEDVAKSQEEKRKHIKTLIEKIPTEKEALFAFQLDWAAVDNQLMERRIRPWIHKKIIEYIGEPEPTLVDFICSKVLARSAPQGILDDVQMVLDEEAEVFVVKMWRLLIYEIEAKKLGLVK